MLFREYCHGIRSNLVGNVAIGGNAVGANDDGIDQSLTHEAAGHVIGNDADIDAVFPQFPRREPRALEKRPCLVGQDTQTLSVFNSGANNAQRRSITCGGERAGVAVCEDRAGIRQQLLAKAADALVTFDVLGLNRQCLLDQPVCH